MSKLVFFSDLHLHLWPEFGAEERLNDGISVLTDIRTYCVKHKIERVFFGGDFFHKKGVLFTRPYVLAVRELVAFKEAGIHVYAAVGNHDHEDKAGKHHALEPMSSGGLLTCHDTRFAVQFDMVHVDVFSYCDDPRELKRRVRSACEERDKRDAKHAYRIGLFHHGFEGARVGSVLEYVVKEPVSAESLKLDKRYDLVLSGHYHCHQKIRGVKNGWYIGSPMEHTRSDREDGVDTVKGFIVVDVAKRTWKRVPLLRPRFIQMRVGRDKLLRKVVQGNFVDVQYERAGEALDDYIKELQALEPRGIKPVLIESDGKTEEPEKRLDVSPELATSEVLKRYLKYRKDDVKELGLDREALLRRGLNIIEAAEQEE